MNVMIFKQNSRWQHNPLLLLNNSSNKSFYVPSIINCTPRSTVVQQFTHNPKIKGKNLANCTERVAQYNKMSYFIYKIQNITTKLNWKLITKIIRTNQRSLGLDRQSLMKRSTSTLIQREQTESLIKRGKCQALQILREQKTRECLLRSKY